MSNAHYENLKFDVYSINEIFLFFCKPYTHLDTRPWTSFRFIPHIHGICHFCPWGREVAAYVSPN
jgi:hypothetical protein